MAMTAALNEFDSRKNKENSQKLYTDIMTALRLENYPPGIKISKISKTIYRSEYIAALQTLINACTSNNITLTISRRSNNCYISTDDNYIDLKIFEKYSSKEYNKIRGKYTNAKAYYEELTKDLREKSSSIPSDDLNPDEQIMLIDELKSEGKKIENEQLIRKWAEKLDDLQTKFFKIKGIKTLFDKTSKSIKECTHNLVFIPLGLYWERDGSKDTEGHANIIIIDKVKRTIELYESNYICSALEIETDERQETANNFVKIFARHLKLRYSAPCDICTLTGLQIFGDTLNKKEFHPKKEPDGYCQAYSLLWLALRAIYYDMNKTELHRMMETMNKTHIRALIKNFAYTLLLKADRIGYSSSSMDIDPGKSFKEIIEENKEKEKEKKRKISENIKAIKPEVDILASNIKKMRIAGSKRKSKK